jgi:hypothetical protein
MTAPQAATTEDLAGQLNALAADLQGLGLRTRTLPGRFPPCLTVTNPQVVHLSETIYAANARDGAPSFWWSWGDPIDAITNTEAAATKIARVLA